MSIYDRDTPDEKDIFGYYEECARCFHKASGKDWNKWRRLAFVGAIGGPLTTLLLLIPGSDYWITIIKGLPAGLAGIATTLNSTFNYKDEYIRRDQANEAIHREIAKYRFGHKEYNVENRLSRFVEICNGIVEAENAKWAIHWTKDSLLSTTKKRKT